MFRALLLVLLLPTFARTADKPPIHLWLEPEWFEGVNGFFGYWTGEAKPTGTWGVAGPGISAEWTQGGESEWNSMGVPAAETKAVCGRNLVIPRGGQYKVWVRYVDHRKKTEPFSISIKQKNAAAITGELGTKPVVPENDEYQLYWGFSFGWAALEGTLAEGAARVEVSIDKAGDAWRQVDAILITDDLNFVPNGREKPPFAYLSSFDLEVKDGAKWRGSAKNLTVGGWERPKLGGKDFTMWTGIEADAKAWAKLNVNELTPFDLYFQQSPTADIREAFHKQFAGQKNLPILSFPHLVPGLYLGVSPDLSPGTPLRTWLERTKSPFYVMTNYANPTYTDKTGPATYHALIGPLAGQFLGYIHGEAYGTVGVRPPDKPLGQSRRDHADAMMASLKQQQAAEWSKFYKTPVPDTHWAKGISCLSTDSIALAHLYHASGAKVVGYELDATNVHTPMRIAFERGAARQFGGAWINYASGNFGDACNYFTQSPTVPRGAPAWFHSKYAITDGVSIGWYRKMYYLNYLGGTAAIFWEQNLGNQWMLPGPGKHPIQLSPFGRATEDFQSFVGKLPDRGEPITPVGVLLSAGHSYDRVNYMCKMLHVHPEDAADRELRELFNVMWHPVGIAEGQPAAPDVQSLPNGRYGNIFDVLVDRPTKAAAISRYPILWAAGDVDLSGAWTKSLEDYVRNGGTLVVSAEAARKKLPDTLLGLSLSGTFETMETWQPDGDAARATTPYQVERVKLGETKVIAWAKPEVPLITRHAVGAGAVIVTLVPRMLGLDERAHAALPYLMNGLSEDLLPVEVLRADGKKLLGELMYQVNRTADGYLVLLVNNRGVDKTQNGVARVDRRQFVDVIVRSREAVKAVREYTQPRELTAEKNEVRLRVHPGDVQVIGMKTK